MVVHVERMWEFMTKGLDFGLRLWRLHHTMPGQRPLLLALFNPFFGLSTKFGHSIPHSFDLDTQYPHKNVQNI